MAGAGPSADGRASARVYGELKQAIVSGEFKLRQRLDIEKLAQRWRVSATPIRQSLAVLAAERLVKLDGARGYCVAFWSEGELRELYGWRGALARLAAETYEPAPLAMNAGERRRHASAFARVMAHLQARAGAELRLAARAADERLCAALAVEPDVLEDSARELAELVEALGRRDRRLLQRRLRGYFQRRARNAATIRARAGVQALPKNGD